MYRALGDQWASSVFAFLAMTCTPMAFMFVVSLNWNAKISYTDLRVKRHGAWIRSKSKYASIANVLEQKVQGGPISESTT